MVLLHVLQSRGIWHTAQKAAEILEQAKHIMDDDLEQQDTGVCFGFYL